MLATRKQLATQRLQRVSILSTALADEMVLPFIFCIVHFLASEHSSIKVSFLLHLHFSGVGSCLPFSHSASPLPRYRMAYRAVVAFCAGLSSLITRSQPWAEEEEKCLSEDYSCPIKNNLPTFQQLHLSFLPLAGTTVFPIPCTARQKEASPIMTCSAGQEEVFPIMTSQY